VAKTGTTATFTVTASGKLLRYQWQKAGVDITGATTATLTLTNVQTADGASYRVVVSNGGGSVNSSVAVLTVVALPAVTTVPAPRTALDEGQPFSLSVAATSGSALTYQWKKDGRPIAGATTTNFSLASVRPGDAGVYTVEITDAIGQVVRKAAFVNVGTLSVQTLAWGDNASGQTVLPASATDLVAVSAGAGHNLAVKKDGTVVAWGETPTDRPPCPRGWPTSSLWRPAATSRWR